MSKLPIKAHINWLQHVMNCASWLVADANKSEHITSLMKGLYWLPVEQHLKFNLLCMTYSAWHLRPITALLHPICVRVSSPTSWLGPYILLALICCASLKWYWREISARAFSSVVPSLYNAIQLDISQAPSYDYFKANLKNHLFSIAYNLS